MSKQKNAVPIAARIIRSGGSAAAVITIIVLTGAAWILLAEPDREDPHAELDRAAVPVNVMSIRLRAVPVRPQFLAQAEASQTVEIRSRARGFLEERMFTEGGSVERDSVLFRIDPKPFEAALEVARARVTSAGARKSQAQRQVDRYRGLYEQGAATASELEEWETALQVAASDIELYAAQLTQAELELSYTRVTSPIDGQIGRALKDVGTYVDDGSGSLLAVIQSIDPMYIRFSMSEQDLLRYRALRANGRLSGNGNEGVEVRLTLRDGSAHTHTGRISFVDVRVDDLTSTVLLRATVPNPAGRLRPGQYLHVTMLGLERPSLAVIPKQAVLHTPSSASVYVLDEENETAVVRHVRLGDWRDDGWIIEEGLHDGDMLIVDNIMRLRPGAPVIVDQAVTLEELASADVGAEAQ